ncbi:rhodanese-like domain-containing protein [Verrucosispora sioxanthis]|uniref:rhodanese-like domain-containing protein n=1 Tax=Verrucosispora sioxanthis TaxID=2499994 RepID=UPI00209FDCAD
MPDDRPVVVHCAGGYRSSVAASLLRAAGRTDVSDLLGGYGAWQALRQPTGRRRRGHARTAPAPCSMRDPPCVRSAAGAPVGGCRRSARTPPGCRRRRPPRPRPATVAVRPHRTDQ